MRNAVAALLILCACNRHGPANEGPPAVTAVIDAGISPSAPSAVATSPDDAGVPAACAGLGSPLSIDVDSYVSQPSFAGACLRSKAGAWAIWLKNETTRACNDGSGCKIFVFTYEVIHFDAAGNATRRTEKFEQSMLRRTSIGPAMVSDLDGRDDDELVVPASFATYSGADEGKIEHETGVVYRFADGKIDVYPPSKNLSFFDARDVDADGKLDLLTHVPFVATVVDNHMPVPFSVNGPILVRHCLADGTFSSVDDTAKRFARSQCPAPPVFLLSADGGAPDGHRFSRLACARLWGKKSDDVRSELARECPQLAESTDPDHPVDTIPIEICEDGGLPLFKTSPFTL